MNTIRKSTDAPGQAWYNQHRLQLLLLVTTCSFLLSANVPSLTPSRPNIIYIMADDMGYSDIGCYGGEVNTPNLDQLAAKGIKLRSFYNNARCCPTRASLLTGRFPHQVGMGLMVTTPPASYEPGNYQGFLDPGYATVAELLKKEGYHTYMSGKWHVGERPEHWPRKRGFDHYFGLISGASSYYEILPQEKSKRHVVLEDKDYDIPQEGFYMTDAFTDHALEYLETEKKRKDAAPFFLYLAYTAPHFPIHSPDEALITRYEKIYASGWDIIRKERYAKMKKLGLVDASYHLTERPADIPAWENATDKKTWIRKMAVYAAMIERMDQNIGRLVATLKANGQYEHTMIVFLSDNGGCAENTNNRNFNDSTKLVGQRGSYYTYDMPWANVSNTPFRKYKHFMHEGGIITPCILQWPEAINPQKGYLSSTGHVTDLMPTALELAGAAAPEGIAGQSLSYLWKNKQAPERTICWEHEGNKAIRTGSWKLVKDWEDPDWELYNITADPSETRNLATQYPDRVSSMKKEYETWAQNMHVKPPRRSATKSE
ncbi:MAG: arylsulfatase [Bacteroidetes bacterium]|nr:arylsulfatase [Bacteroidota bacterium]